MLDSPNEPPNREIKDYLDRRFGRESAALYFIRAHSHDEKLPEIQISIHMGKMLYLLAKIQNPRRILEIGTLGGYSAAWLVQALPPQGRLISLEINPEHAAQAYQHFQELKEDRVEIRVGHAVELLAQLATAHEEPFDLIFIDADKENNVLYLEWSLRLSRPGTLILIDNLIPKGSKVGYPSHEEAKAIYAFNDYLVQHSALEVAAFPTLVGPQGRLDALAIAYVT